MKRSVVCTLLLTLLYFIPQAQIGVFQKVITDSSFSKDYRFRSLPNYSLYNGITNIISPTTGTYDLTTPPGTTAGRPIVPTGKYILRYNTDSSALEIGNPSQVWRTLAQSSVSTFDTSSINNFGLKVRSLFSATSPLQYNAVTGNIQIPQATSSTAGYLASADWITFNAKLPDPGVNGIVVRTASGITAARQLVAASTNISLVNPTGVSGNPSIDVNDTLTLNQLHLPAIPSASPGIDSALIVNRSTGLLEVRAIAAAGSLTDIRRRSGIDTVEKFVNGSWQFAFIDSIGISSANNGLSKSGNIVQWGQTVSETGNPAALLSTREIPLNGFNAVFTGTGGLGIGTSTVGSNKLNILASSTTQGVNITTATGRGININSTNIGLESTVSGAASVGIKGATSGGAGSYGMQGSGGIGGTGGRFYTIAEGGDASPIALELERQPTGAGVSNGAGFTVMFRNAFTNGTTGNESGRITNYFSNAVSGAQTSAFGFHLVNGAVSARKALLAGNGQWTWDGYPALTAQVDTTTFKPLVIDGSGNVMKMAGWAGSGGGASDWNAVLALGGRFSANRNVSMASRRLELDSTALRLYNVDSVSTSINMVKPGIYLEINPPVLYPGYKRYQRLMEHDEDDVPGEFNNPEKNGFNVNRAFNPAVSGIWWSMEPNYRPGGAKFMETILEVSLPNGVVKNSRLLMSTFVEYDSIGNSQNKWDFRGTGWEFMNLLSTVSYVTMGVGTLNVNNSTAASTDFSISNGPDIAHFTMSPGTGIVEYTGAPLMIDGNVKFRLRNMVNTERALFPFESDGGRVSYIGHYGSAWGVQPFLQKAMVITNSDAAALLNPSLVLKDDGTGWLGDIDTYNTGTQNVNLSGTLALRGIGFTNTASEVLVRRSDSTILAITTTDLATLLGVGGNTLYTGDGTITGNRVVTQGSNTIDFNSTINSDAAISITNSGTSSIGLFSNGSLFGVDAQSTNVGLRAFGTVAGLTSTGDGSEGAIIRSNAIRGATIQSVPTSTNTVQEVIRLERGVNGSPGANGIGGSLTFYNKRTDNASDLSNEIISKFTNAVAANLTSQMLINGVNNGTPGTIATFDGNGNVTFGATNAIVGTATNNNATAGNIGEEVNSTISTYTNYTTSATYQNITSITLTPGDWDLTAFFTYSSNSATITASSNAIFVISTTTASASGSTEGKNIAYLPQAALLGTSMFSDAITPYRISISGTTTYYLNTQATFTVGNPQYTGTLRARRIR